MKAFVEIVYIQFFEKKSKTFLMRIITMIKKINTVTIKIMGRIKVIVKYLMFTFVMLGFFSSIVQTATYVKFRFKSNYNITSGEASRSGKSGEVFFTTLGAGRSGTANEKFSEDNWSEVGSQSDNSVEEMEEGSYLGFNNCLNPTNWDHDRCNRKGIGEEDDSWPSELEAFKDDITDPMIYILSNIILIA